MNEKGDTALIWSTWKGYLEIVNTLLTKNVNVNYSDQSGYSPLMIAAKNGHLDIVKTLLAHNNANIDDVDVNGNTALLFATKYNHWQIKKIIMQVNQLNQLKAANLINLINAKEMILNINNVLNEQLKKTNEIKDNQNDNEIWKNNQEEIIEMIDNYEHNLNQKLKNINSELNNHSLKKKILLILSSLEKKIIHYYI
ncbi:ankyrin repeat domain-containing protein [Spiroplasma endosymbiont of Danaus chrysippus]|uniref:ankyrin repeat domain-containing protein n=1 Tax=Spiroplasma endosymbiont of Danaus chrysippus TaxID=2691041 RepID=UPI00157AA49B|nr:ankyrin repeat domain-containing protein [Spiroplasma endosymbiont of Danaus chrysippus]